jgi:16S rRNA (uracil1498-N3)-methyltransferase
MHTAREEPMPPRFFVDLPLGSASTLMLPAGPARHVQVLRLQPGAAITLFDGGGGEWTAEVLRIGRGEVQVRLGTHDPIERELALAVTLALGMPANERMDTLVEKATELGVAAIEPLICERSVLRLAGERAERRRTHWQGIAVAAAEQCGRTRLPLIGAVRPFAAALGDDAAVRFVLSLHPQARPWSQWLAAAPFEGLRAVRLISGPEGGLSQPEEQLAIDAGALPASLGPRTLRADTAPLAALAALAVHFA